MTHIVWGGLFVIALAFALLYFRKYVKSKEFPEGILNSLPFPNLKMLKER
jgi:hypothetical protein